MIKVLFFGMTNVNGGIENFSLNYVKKISCHEIKIDFIDIYNGIFFEDELKKCGSNIIKITNYRNHPMKAYKEIVSLIKKNKYDVIHYNMNSAVFLLPLIAGKICNVSKVIAHSHNASNDKGILKSILHFITKHFIPLFANYYFACSDKAAKWFFSKKTINSDKFYIINNAIDVDKFDYNEIVRKKIRDKLQINDKLIIGHVGRFNKQKNHEYLLDIFINTLKIIDNVNLMLVGTGPLEDDIKSKVKNFNIQDKVMFMENRSDVNELMQGMDILVMPSFYEGLSLVTVESQCAALPCLLSDTISQEVKILDTTCFLNINCSADIWAKKIVELLNNSKRDSVREKIIKNNFDINTEALKLKEIYLK